MAGDEDLPLQAEVGPDVRDTGSRWLVLAGFASVFGGILFGGIYGLVEHAEGPTLFKYAAAGAAAGVVFELGLVLFRAYQDAMQMREATKAHNVTEDAWTAYAMGDIEKSEELLKEALESCLKRLGERNLTTLTTMHSLANLYRTRGLWKEADTLYNRALPMYHLLVGPGKVGTAVLMRDLALNYEGQRKLAEAIEAAKESLKIMEKTRGKESFPVSEAQCLVGRLLADMGDDQEASEAYGRAVDIQRQLLTTSDPTFLKTLSAYSRCLFKLRRYHETEQYLTTLLAKLDEMPDPDYASLVEALLDLGTLRLVQERYHDAEPLFVRGLKTLQHYVGPTDRLMQKILDGYKMLVQKGAVTEAAGVVNLVILFHGERDRIRQIFEESPLWINSRDSTGWGPLQWAAFIGRDDVVRWLLNRGADSTFDAETCMGPLHVACAWNRRESLLELLAAGANVNGKGAGGWTAIHWCAHYGRAKLAELLIKKGADANVRDDNTRTPLHVAAAQGHVQMAASLIGAGSSVNAKEKVYGRTPLHMAAHYGHLAVCECLIFNRAELKAQDNQGLTPLNLAEKGKHRLLARAMRKHLSAGLGR